MIKSFRDIGEYYLRKKGYYDTQDENKKMQIFLVSQVIQPRDDWGRELIINLDIKKKTIEFKLGRELSEDIQEELFAFGVNAPRDKRKFLSTNYLENHIAYTINDTISYIEDKKIKDIDNYYNLFKKLRDIFCIEDNIKKGDKVNKVFYLNYQILIKTQKELFINCYNEKKENSKSKELYLNDVYKYFISNLFTDFKDKQPKIISLLVNDENLIKEFSKEYYCLLKNDLLDNKIIIKKFSSCSICNIIEDKIFNNIPFNIYGATNPKYFENLNSNNSYKAFSLCQKCYINTSVGIKYIDNNYKINYLWGADEVLLIPNNIKFDNFDYEKAYKYVLEKFKSNRKDILDKYKEIFIKGIKKNLTFDLLFYLVNKQQLSVIKHLSYLEFKKLNNLFEIFDKYNEIYYLLNIKISLADVYWLLFPNKNLKQDIKPEIYRKELIDFYSSILNCQPLSYNEMILRFTKIFYKVFNNKNKEDKKQFINEPLRMNILISILNEYTIVKGGNKMLGNSLTKITDDEIEQFFKIHADIYKENNYRQGLFLMGFLINQILKIQRDKSSTFLDKINFDGIPKRRVFSLISDIKNYYKIYKNKEGFYDNTELWAQTLDRLQSIENSDLNKDEIVFYILSGISYSQYVGIKKSKENKLKQKEGGK